jgi:hypothetical protein
MKFLRGLRRGPSEGEQDQPSTADGPDDLTSAPEEPDIAADAADQERDLVVLREEQARIDALAQRQQRYADYAWRPPAQGGERRADDPVDGQGGR